jgi:hypothetical protein
MFQQVSVRHAVVVLSFTVLSLGCESDEHADHDPLEELCEHMLDGPAVAKTLGADAASAVDLTGEHQRLDLTLVDATFDGGATGKGGHGTLSVDEAGDWLFGLADDVEITVRGPDGKVIDAEATSKDPASCSALKKVVTYELAVGQHTVQVGPGTLAATKVVIEHTEGEAHDH